MRSAVSLPLLLLVLLQTQHGWSHSPPLNVFISYGRDLRQHESSSKTDAYIKVKVGDSTLTSRVIRGNRNPIWKQWLRFTCVPSKHMWLYVYDKGGGQDLSGGLLGKKGMRLAKGDRWFTIRMKHGMVRVYYYYR